MKVYLNTAEEFIKALVEGKTMYEDFCTTEKFRTIKFVNGICVSKYHNGLTVINEFFRIDEERNFYYEEKEPIKLEVGKFYKTRDGDKVCCFYKYKTNYEFNWAFIKVNEQPDRAIFKSRDNGRQWQSENAYHSNDIVDYWED